VILRRLLLLLLALGALLLAPAAACARDRFATDVFALTPRPGFPAHAFVHPDGHVYEGTYTNPGGDTVASRVFEYSPVGALLRSWTVTGQNLAGDHGVQVAASDARGRLVLLDKSPARALILDRTTGDQTVYAAFPAGAVPNYAAWGPDGSLYVTDYEQPILWKVPPRGGPPVKWLEDARLSASPFGATGINLAADGATLLVATQSQANGSAGNPSTGRIWKIGIGADGKPTGMTQLWESRPADGPDGFAIARSGTLYIALLAVNQLAVINADGTERERFPALPGSGANGSAVPFDAPSSVRFLGTRLMVANQAYVSGDATHQAILDVEAGEQGLPALVPANAGPPPPAQATPKKKAKKKAKKKKKKKPAPRKPAAKRG
jgi:sugar lactone lactonase YvrE